MTISMFECCLCHTLLRNDVCVFTSPRAAEFCAKDSRQLADWFSDVGLDMYTDIVERNLASGEKLVTMVAANNNELFAVSY